MATVYSLKDVPGFAEGATPGATSLEEWSQATDFLYARGIINTQVDPATLFTNDFVPE